MSSNKKLPSTTLKEVQENALKLLSNPRFFYYKQVLTECVLAGSPLSLKDLTKRAGLEYEQKAYYYAEKLVSLSILGKIKRGHKIFYVPNEHSEPILKFFSLKSSTGSTTPRKPRQPTSFSDEKSDRIEKSNQKLIVRLHAFKMSSDLIHRGYDPSNPRKAKLKNWQACYYTIPTPQGYVTAKVTTKRVIFYAPPILDDPEEAEKKAIQSIQHAIKVMHEFGWQLGPPQPEGRPHWGVKAKQLPPFDILAKNMTMQNDVGSIDMSPGEPEVEIYQDDPKTAKKALLSLVELPGRLDLLEQKISLLEQATVKIASSLERLVGVFSAVQDQPGPQLDY